MLPAEHEVRRGVERGKPTACPKIKHNERRKLRMSQSSFRPDVCFDAGLHSLFPTGFIPVSLIPLLTPVLLHAVPCSIARVWSEWMNQPCPLIEGLLFIVYLSTLL